MSKMSTDENRTVLHGPTMGTRWSVTLAGPADTVALTTALQQAVDRVDAQMSTWKPGSDLMRLNRAAVRIWQAVPPELMAVLRTALRIGECSDGLFDIGVGDLVSAWGFGARGSAPDTGLIGAQLGRRRPAAHEVLELDVNGARVRRMAPLSFDLSGIAKGFAVDQMMRVLADYGVTDALAALDGELAARGTRPDGTPWAVAVERPDHDRRAPMGVIDLGDMAVATSGDYRHWVTVGKMRLSHTMDPRLGGPARNRLASVTVLHPACMAADAWATALLVAGEDAAPDLARRNGLDALFVLRDGPELRQFSIGPRLEARQAVVA
ncbi:MAG: FAD:protein FMN transferase [Rhodobacteraceae bacterium]|nr:FAD:protein FMN transferase [Paracoccaceae bacterium]